MRRIIKVTESQLRITEGDAYAYIDDENNDTPHYNQTQTSAQGYVDDAEFGGPLTTDQADVMTPQNWYRGYRGAATTTFIPNTDVFDYDRQPYLKEAMNDDDGNGIENFDEVDDDANPIIDVLSNNDEDDNLAYISKTIEKKTDELIGLLQGVASRQQIYVLNNLIQALNIKNLSYSWLNTLKRKINMRNNVRNDNFNDTFEVDVNNGIPPTVNKTCQTLIRLLSKQNDQKKAMVLNELIEKLELSEVPLSLGRRVKQTLINQR